MEANNLKEMVKHHVEAIYDLAYKDTVILATPNSFGVVKFIIY